MKAGGLALLNLIQPTISLEMPVPNQGHYGFHSFPVVRRNIFRQDLGMGI
jgi:hypothetical protein